MSLVVHARLTAAPERVLERLREPVEMAAAAVGPADGPLAGAADVTVADPRALLGLLEGLL